jgi:general secretion pathway protein N
MNNLFRQNPLASALVVLAALLVVVIAVEASFGLWPSQTAHAPSTAAPSEVKLLPPLASVVAEQAYPETAARPLFTPTRRPAPAAPAVAGNMVKGQFMLTGVIAVGDLKIALLKEKASGKVHRVERGKEISGMTLSNVEPERVTLAQGGDEEVLTLSVQKGPAPATAGAAAAVAPQVGMFGPAPGQPAPAAGPAAAVPPGMPTPAAPSQPPTPPVAAGAANPAQRSMFGPFPNQAQQQSQPQPQGDPSESKPMTPEELLARRRARRGQ